MESVLFKFYSLIIVITIRYLNLQLYFLQKQTAFPLSALVLKPLQPEKFCKICIFSSLIISKTFFRFSKKVRFSLSANMAVFLWVLRSHVRSRMLNHSSVESWFLFSFFFHSLSKKVKFCNFLRNIQKVWITKRKCQLPGNRCLVHHRQLMKPWQEGWKIWPFFYENSPFFKF